MIYFFNCKYSIFSYKINQNNIEFESYCNQTVFYFIIFNINHFFYKKNLQKLSTSLSTFQPEIGDFFKHAEAGEKKGVAYKLKKVYFISLNKF